VLFAQDDNDLATACTVGSATVADGTANFSSNISGSSTNLGSITITFSTGYVAAGIQDVAASDWLCIFLRQATNTATDAGFVKNPLVASNPSTKYELFIKTDNVGSAGTDNLMMSIQPVVADRIFEATTATATPFVCQTSMDGAIIRI